MLASIEHLFKYNLRASCFLLGLVVLHYNLSLVAGFLWQGRWPLPHCLIEAEDQVFVHSKAVVAECFLLLDFSGTFSVFIGWCF